MSGAATPEWNLARKRPVIIQFREAVASDDPAVQVLTGKKAEIIRTLEGALFARPGQDFVIKGIKGELYPIRKDIFFKTYEVVSDAEPRAVFANAIPVRTRRDVEDALAAHEATMDMLLQVPEELARVARDKEWSEDRVRGHLEGVQWTYKWFLGLDQK